MSGYLVFVVQQNLVEIDAVISAVTLAKCGQWPRSRGRHLQTKGIGNKTRFQALLDITAASR